MIDWSTFDEHIRYETKIWDKLLGYTNRKWKKKNTKKSRTNKSFILNKIYYILNIKEHLKIQETNWLLVEIKFIMNSINWTTSL